MTLADLSLLELVPALHPEWSEPRHLAEWCTEIEGAIRGGTRSMCSVPFQHYKSTTTLVGVVWLLLRRPTLSIIVMTHSHEKAVAMGKDLRELFDLAGVKMKKGFNTIHDYQTEAGGRVVVMSCEQSKLGYPHDVLLVDDPLDEKEYMLRDTRDRADATIGLYTARGATHLDSVLIVASRWDLDDPIGRRCGRTGWRYFQHAGIEELGTPNERAFAPDVLDLRGHRKMRAEWAEIDPSERRWYAQVQNNPLPAELGFFSGDPPDFTGTVSPGAHVLFGVDAAFTSGKKSDYFAVVGGVLAGDGLGVFLTIRHQRGLVAGLRTLHALKAEYPYARFVSYVSGAEKGIYDALFQEGGLEVEQMPARWSKGYRAQKSAKSWRDGKILIRRGQSWTGPLIAEVHAFDGREDDIDDQVDGLVAMHDALMASRPVAGFGTQFTFGSPGAAG
jgi:hypothetical protein